MNARTGAGAGESAAPANRTAERGLFFGAGLVFGVVAGVLFARSFVRPAGELAGAAPPPSASVSMASPSSGSGASLASGGAAEAPRPEPVDPDELAALFEAVEARPDDPAARAAVAELYLDALDFGEATRWFRQARNLDPSDPDIQVRLALALLGLGGVEEATSLLSAVVAENPEHPPGLLALGRVRLYFERDLEAGMALWERLLEVAPDSPEARAVARETAALRSAH